jgi:hypothetical protein
MKALQMNKKGCGRKRSWHDYRQLYYPYNCHVRLRKTSKVQCPGWDSDRVRSSDLHILADRIADKQHPNEGVELMCPSRISHNSCGLCLTSERIAPSCPPAWTTVTQWRFFNPSSWLSVRRFGNNWVKPNAIFTSQGNGYPLSWLNADEREKVIWYRTRGSPSLLRSDPATLGKKIQPKKTWETEEARSYRPLRAL